MHKPQTSTQDIYTLYSMIDEDMQLMDSCILQNLQSKVTLINQVSDHITQYKGKRLRPALMLLVARHFAYDGQQHVTLAAIIELIHSATLLHDDVVDASLLRRGQETINQQWGNEAGVLIGDFLFSRAFQMMLQINSMRVIEILAEATNTIAEGEVQQLIHNANPYTTETDYINIIQNKTAKLFEAAARLGTILSKRSAIEEQQMAKYGMHLGTAFQLVDDILDYNADQTLGKNIGDDLAEGRPTLPLLYAMLHSNNEEQKIIQQAINGKRNDIEAIQHIIKNTGAIEYTVGIAQKEAALASAALSQFTDSQYLDAMYNMAQYTITRKC